MGSSVVSGQTGKESGRRVAREMFKEWRMWTLSCVLVMLPLPAYAQRVPLWVVAAALSPIVVLLLCIIVGVLARSLKTGVIHTGLLFGWIILFILISQTIENDYLNWTPLFLYALHALVLVGLIIWHVVRLVRGRGASV